MAGAVVTKKIRVRRRLYGVNGERLHALCADARAYRNARVLARKTAEYMVANQIGPEVKNLVGSADPTRADYGFGLGTRGTHHARHRAYHGFGRGV